MAITVILGMQWGDEGKGKIIDVLAEEADMVVRFQGGNNAGHTVEIGDNKFILHLVPSGILRAETQCVIGNGMVVDPLGLVEEIRGLESKGIAIRERLQISGCAQLVFSCHKVIDGWHETEDAGAAIGTTRRGIGPAYSDKANRVGIRAAALKDLSRFEHQFRALMERYNRLFTTQRIPLLDVDAEWRQVAAAADYLAPLVADTVSSVNQAVRAKKNVLFEGAQGVWLDIDHGTYPYVTSSSTTIGGVCTGAGVAPRYLEKVLGVAKAYTTRVGEGPFPTELDPVSGTKLREAGNEYGATTGRPRRCGWFDAVATARAAMFNGVDSIAITKLDVLDNLDRIEICTAYRLDGKILTDMPVDAATWARVEPVYETCAGWCSDTTGIRAWRKLPDAAKRYLDRLAELVAVPISIVSVGPRRDQVLFP